MTYHRDKPADKFEILQVIRINVRRRIYLQAVIALVCILEETIHRVQYFVAQKEKPFSAIRLEKNICLTSF